MGNCDMCGKESELFIIEIEDTRMNVCSSCAGFGKKIRRINPEIKTHKQKQKQQKVEAAEKEPEIIQMIVLDYPKIIKKKREQMGMKQKEFARHISEKESLVHSMEVGKFKPSMKIAAKLEHMLNIKLIEDVEETTSEHAKTDRGKGLTLGDFIKKK
ncbi:MAG: multiprotein bridging factor aMBF1 [Nanoarchaeota archaeon]|nr:multiprotein bridging factor aMBF1 [Nanoarchaeota archaeon]